MYLLSSELYANIRLAVASGAKWLDANNLHWHTRIDMETLDVGENCGCVIGQLYGPFEDFCYGLMNRRQAVQRGFLCTTGLSIDEIDAYYEYATQCWMEEVAARRFAQITIIVAPEMRKAA